MKLTTNRKVSLTVLGLAITALAVDRVFLAGSLGPSEAMAADVDHTPLTVTPNQDETSNVRTLIAQRFGDAAGRRALDAGDTPDAFDPSHMDHRVQAIIDAEAPTDEWHQLASGFRDSHQVTSIGRDVAVVNGNVWRAGKPTKWEHAGVTHSVTLIKAEMRPVRRVLVELNGRELEVTLPDPDFSGNG